MPTAPTSADTSTLQILTIVFFTFISFLCIGLPLAVLPGYVLYDLGYSSILAGVVIGTQYFSTLLTRPMSGSIADRLGAKQGVLYGLIGCSVSGAVTLLATYLVAYPLASLILLLIGRVILGVSQGLVGTGSISWGIGRVGPDNTARVISWNGIASYGAVALGAPMGVLMASSIGLWSIGGTTLVLAGAAFFLARIKTPAPIIHGTRLAFRRVFMKVAPNGVALALGSIGFGTLATFITLYYDSRGWDNAAYCLSAFGGAFIVARLLFSSTIKKRGGYRVATVCLIIETIGLLLVWLAATPWITLCGAALTGFGLSLVYPALGVEIISRIPPASRSSALGAYAVFFDLSLGIAGPLMGAIAGHFGFGAIFMVAAVMAFSGMLLTLLLKRIEKRSTA
ncbi:MFS transporter [Pseudomonas sp. EL_65y_Pfl2_R95]|uniref:MFS transporter n=1 Tax=Pseudomonas sp. EL_65y_Pfl2_R95 TaxID=3088698 RepID=UPI0030DB4B29